MFKRVKQFITAVSAKINGDDLSFINSYLSLEEQKLFWCMNVPEQRHALDVAYTAGKLAEAYAGIDRRLLLKSALLHDVGKVRGDISIPGKVITVIGDTVCPRWTRRLAREGRGGVISNLRHAFYIYYNHAARGADMLTGDGAQREVGELVRRHHEPVSEQDAPELKLLKIADDLN